MADPTAAAAQQIRNIEQATGRTVADWAGLVSATGLTNRLRQAVGMCTHRVALVDTSDVDDEVAAWLRDAYELAGPT